MRWQEHLHIMGGEPSLLKIEKLNNYIDLLSKTSSVSLGTNGLIYLEKLSNNLASIGVALHGTKKVHENLTRIKGGYTRAIRSIKGYVSRNFEVRVASTLTSKNYFEMYDIIRIAAEMGVGSVFINKFECGGIGSRLARELAPSLKQFKMALNQIIAAKKDFGIPVGFGSAIPFCIDKRLVKERLISDCGAGFTFATISPNGDVRICNQSQKTYGNILKTPLEKIWQSKEINHFRSLYWVTEPCSKCPIMKQCLCGCKVDTSYNNEYCVDYIIRNFKNPPLKIIKIPQIRVSYPKEYRRYRKDRFLKINNFHNELYVVTKLQVAEVNKEAKEILEFIQRREIILEKEIIQKFGRNFDKKSLRKLLTKLEMMGALVRI
jgi:radical SAM protein with 4Fe4S-binding SPASM domain